MNTIEYSNVKLAQPEIPGLILRHFQGEADYAFILSLLHACNEFDKLERSDSLQDIQRNYSHLYNCDPYRDMLFAEVDGQPAGYCRCWWLVNGEGQWIGFSLAFVHPAWRRKGIGTAFFQFCEGRLRQTSAQLIADGLLDASAPRFFEVDEVNETETAREALLTKFGYVPVRYGFGMVRPDLENIPDLPLPDGLEVRPVLPEHYRLIHDASNEAFQDHWGYISEPEEEYQKMLEDSNFDPSLWRVAWAGDQVAGMVCSFINKSENVEYNRKRGYTENISVRRPWRKQGLASALIALSLKAIKERGMTEAALGVDSQNLSGALRLYEKMGYRKVKQAALYRKELR